MPTNVNYVRDDILLDDTLENIGFKFGNKR